MPRKTKEEAEETRHRILDSALDLFSEKGYGHTTLNDIAERAGFTRGAVYWHFKDKVELFLAMSDELEEMPALENLFAQPITNLHDLRHLLVGYLGFIINDERYRKYHEVVNFKTEWTQELEPVLKRNRRLAREIINLLKKDLAKLKHRGLLNHQVNPERSALAALALLEGLIALWLFDPKLFSLKDQVEPLIDDFLQGLKPSDD